MPGCSSGRTPELVVTEQRALPGFARWKRADCEPLTGDASARKYFRLRGESQTAILMDASRVPDSLAPFIRIAEHLRQLGFSAPQILARDIPNGLLLLEDFGDENFARLLNQPAPAEPLFTLATDVLIALHRHPQAIPENLRAYHPEKMLEDIELFVQWRTPGVSPRERDDFRSAWRAVLPLAQRVPETLLLRDYHVANLMWLPERDGIRQAGLLDFQDAYRGPVTYDLISLLQDARRDVPAELQSRLLARYLAAFPELNRELFEISCAILAAQRHTRVLGIFERLARHEGKLDYRRLHSPRVERLLQKALRHPMLADVKNWMERHARMD
jgi:aminoglycoside/choline kinase family phosphotransferase